MRYTVRPHVDGVAPYDGLAENPALGPVAAQEAAGLALYETARILLDKLTEDVAEMLEGEDMPSSS